MSGHTPGPWSICEDAANATWHVGSTIGSDFGRVADVFTLRSNIEVTANARLIAAAPAMLEALKHIEQTFGEGNQTLQYERDALERARKVIAKAEGRT